MIVLILIFIIFTHETVSKIGEAGALKLSVQYAGGVLSVLILHAQSLDFTPQDIPPNPYVKVFKKNFF